MNYEIFKWSLLEAVRNQTDSGTTVRLQHISGINGVDHDGITLSAPRGRLAPVISLEPYYTRFRNGSSLACLAGDIIDRHIASVRERQLTLRERPDFSAVKDRICFRVINAAMNRQLLETVPHVRKLDLAVIFYIRMAFDGGSELSVMVSLEDQTRWDVTTETLYGTALANTARLKKPVLLPLDRALRRCLEEADPAAPVPEELWEPVSGMGEHGDCGLFLMTTEDRIYGACCLFYPALLQEAARLLDGDLLIIPSSVHEILILVEDTAVSVDMLEETVKTVNETEVLPEEVLSGHVYRFGRHDDDISYA